MFLFNKEKKKNKLGYKNINQYNQIKKANNEKQNYIINDNKNMLNNNIHTKKNIDKIKEITEKITGHRVTMKNRNAFKQLECKFKDGNNSIIFNLTITKNTGLKDIYLISPNLVNGNPNHFKLVIDKIRNKLM